MNRRSGRIPIFLSALVAVLAVGAGIGAIAYSAVAGPDTKTVVRQVPVAGSEPTSNASALTIHEIYQRSYKGVVEITVTSSASGGLGDQGQERAQGSGFVYDTEGHIVTNEHVVDGDRHRLERLNRADRKRDVSWPRLRRGALRRPRAPQDQGLVFGIGSATQGAAHPAADLETVDPRHQHVEDHRVGLVGRLDAREGLAAVRGQLDLVAFQLERTAQRVANGPFVVDDEDLHAPIVALQA